MSRTISAVLIAAGLCLGAAHAEVAGTTLTAAPAIADVRYLQPGSTAGFQVHGGMSARLTRTADGSALAGKLLTFTVSERDVCTVETGSDGRASCSGPNLAIDLAALIYAGGYDVTFAGDAGNAAAAAHGPLARLNGSDLP